MPPLPSVTDLSRQTDFGIIYARQIEGADRLVNENNSVIDQLMYAITRVKNKRYNLEVLLSIAYLERFAINTFQNLGKIETLLNNPSETTENPSAKVKGVSRGI